MSGILRVQPDTGSFYRSHHGYSRGHATSTPTTTSPPVVRTVIASRIVKTVAPKVPPR